MMTLNFKHAYIYIYIYISKIPDYNLEPILLHNIYPHLKNV